MKVSFNKPPEWFLPTPPKGLERLILREPIDDYRSQYVHMFLEDLQHLVPVGSRAETEGFFDLETNDLGLATQVLASLDREYNSINYANSLSKFLSSVAMELFYTGHSVIQISAKYENFEWQVSSLHPNESRIVSFGPLLVQFLPEREARGQGLQLEYETLPKEIRLLDTKNIIRLQLPRRWRSKGKRLMKRLVLLSEIGHPDMEKMLPPTSLENPNPKTNVFDFKEFRRNFDTALFKTLREIGWGARDYSGQEKSDFFTCVWRLRFRKFQAMLRADIIRQLNEQIPKIIQRVNPDFRMTITEQNMLTPEDIDQMESQLYEGKISFKEVVDATFKK